MDLKEFSWSQLLKFSELNLCKLISSMITSFALRKWIFLLLANGEIYLGARFC